MHLKNSLPLVVEPATAAIFAVVVFLAGGAVAEIGSAGSVVALQWLGAVCWVAGAYVLVASLVAHALDRPGRP